MSAVPPAAPTVSAAGGRAVSSGVEDRPEERTRERVARLILEEGPSTAALLAARLGVTPAAIRRHLDGLVADGLAEPRIDRRRGPRGRGRPARVFALTDLGRGAFPQAYDDVALRALSYIRETGGEEAVSVFARRLVAGIEGRFRSAEPSSGPDTSGPAVRESAGTGTSTLAEVLTQEGYAASVESVPLGEQLCQHHCPVAHVAEQFPELCEAETEAFARLLGRHVQRLATIAHGDGVCTTHIPDLEAVLASGVFDPRETTTVRTSETSETSETGGDTTERTTRTDRTRG